MRGEDLQESGLKRRRYGSCFYKRRDKDMRSETGRNLLHAVKISSAAVIAVLLARALGLENAVSAGIVAVLSVAFTYQFYFSLEKLNSHLYYY